ncbi:MAG: hypothetical protein ABI353_10055 [Isosphaeraceae bacterium]
MSDLAFYNVGCGEAKGMRRLVVLARRGVRRILRPIFLRQVELFQSLCNRLDAAERRDAEHRHELDHLTRRQDHLGDQMQHTMAFGWDYVALVRRVAVLEDRLEALAAQPQSGHAPLSNLRAHGPHLIQNNTRHADANH